MAFRTNKMPVLQEKSASGSVVTFNTALAMPLKSCNIALTATQSGSGTPSPDNVRPISGTDSIHIQNTAGINQWDEQWRKGYYNRNNQGAYVSNNSYICNTNDIRVNPNTSYYWFIGISESYLQGRVLFFTADKQYISATEATSVNSVITTPNNCSYIRFYFYNDGNDYDNNCSINYPSTDTSYHAFVGQSVTIQIGSTVYGGEYDARTGVLTVTHKYFDISHVEYYGTYGVDSANLYYCTIPDYNTEVIEPLAKASDNGNITSNIFSQTTGSTVQSMANNEVRTTSANVPERFYFRADSFTDVTDFNSFISNTPIQIVAKLATPTTIQLPPCPIETLLGENNIWADTGDVDLTYKDLDLAKRGNFREVFKLPS